jgi:hypothetical protein
MDGDEAMTLEAGLAALLIAGIRANAPGASAWDAAGIAAALREVGGTPGAAFAAAALAAEDTSLVKPSAAAFRNHWPQNTGVGGPRISHDMACPEHPTHVHPCPVCKAEKPPLSDAAVAELRAVAADAKARTPRAKFATHKRPESDLEALRARIDGGVS